MAISLGEINFGLGADTRRLKAAKDAVVDFGKEVDRAAAATGKGAAAQARAFRQQESAALSALQTILKFNQAVRGSEGPAKFLNQSKKAYAELTAELTSGQLSALNYQRTMERFSATMANLDRQLKEFTASENRKKEATERAEQALLRQERAIFQASQALKNYESQATRLKASAGDINTVKVAFEQLEREMRSGTLSAQQFQAAMFKFRDSMGNANRELANLRGNRISQTLDRISQSFTALAQTAALATGPLGGAASRLIIFQHMVQTLGTAWAGAIAGGVVFTTLMYKIGTAAIDAGKRLDQVRMQLEAVSGSQAIASKEFDYLVQVSKRAGVSLNSIAGEYAKLEAAAKGTGISFEDTRKIFEAVVFTGAKMRLSSDEVGRTLKALQQMMSKGKIQAEELRGQLGDQLPGAFQIMARAMKVSTAELDKMMKDGEVMAADVLPKFAEELKRTYNVDTTKRIETLVSAQERFGTSLDVALDTLDKYLNLSRILMTVYNKMAEALDWVAANIDKVVDGFVILGSVMAGLIAGPVGALATGLVAAIATFGDQIIVVQGRLGTLYDYVQVGFDMMAAGFDAVTKMLSSTDAAVQQSGNVWGDTFEYTVMDRIVMATAAWRQILIRFADNAIALFNGLASALSLPFQTFANALQDYVLAGFNGVMQMVEDLLNGIINKMNEFSNMVNKAAEKLGYTIRLPVLENVDFKPIARLYEGSGQTIAEAFQKGFDETMAERPVETLLGKWADKADLLAKDRISGVSEAARFQREQLRLAQEAWEKYVKAFGSGGSGSGSGSDSIDRAKEAIEDATRQIAKLRAETEALQQGPNFLAQVQEDFKQQEAIDQFNDKLLRAKVSMGQATELTLQFSEALKTWNLEDKAYKLSEVNKELDKLASRAAASQQGPGALSLFDRQQQITDSVEAYRKKLEALGLATEDIKQRTDKWHNSLETLDMSSIAESTRVAQQQIDDLNMRADAIAGGPKNVEALDIAIRIRDATISFRDALVQQGVAMDEANAAAQRYGQAMMRVEQANYDAEHSFNMTKMLGEGLRDAFSGFGSSMLTAFVNGENAAEQFQNVMLRVLGNIIDKMMDMLILQPLIDKMMNSNSMGVKSGKFQNAGGGSSGIGGFLGSMFTSVLGWFFAAKGVAEMPGSRRFGRGGLTDGPTMFNSSNGPIMGGELSTEAIMPLKRMSGGKLGVYAQTDRGGGGGDVIFAPTINMNGAQGGGGQNGQDTGENIANQLFKRMEPLMIQVIRKQQRPGGLLAS